MSDRPESAREAVARWASSSPEEPFLFFRSPRGAFTWWSSARAAAEVERAAANSAAVDAVPAELVARLAAADEASLARARQLVAAVGGSPSREVWISARSLERREERALAVAAALARWALVREPGEALHPALFLWARPTVVSGSALELAELFAGATAEAPRWRRSRWLSRRLSRLAVVFVEGDGAVAEVAAALAALDIAPRVLPFPGGGW